MKFNPYIENLKNYEAGKPIELVVREFGVNKKDIIKLASNENPYGTSKETIKLIKKLAKNMSLYPDDSMYELKDALSKKHRVGANNIIIGSGSDQVIEFAVHAKCDKNRGILQAGVTFAMYSIFASHAEAKTFKSASASHNLDEIYNMYQKYKDEISIIFLCIPNNPLGECLDAKKVYEFMKKIDEETLVIIDGAYNEFASYKDKKKHIDPAFLIKNFKNSLYLGTFSKAYGLGGMRVGYGIASESIIKELSKIRPPFNITNLSLAAAISSLKDEKFLEKTIKNNFKQMKRYEKFAKENRIEFIDSYTNFITLIFNKQDSTAISDKLLREGIIVRNLRSYNMNAIRITIGKKEQNDRVLRALKKLI